MGEKVSEAPEPVPRSCSGRGSRTPAPAAAAASSPGASSAGSSSGSETLSEEGEPGGFSREQPPPPPPPGGALGARQPAAWAPARVVLELGVPAPPPPLPGGAAPPAPRGSSASREEQDEEMGIIAIERLGILYTPSDLILAQYQHIALGVIEIASLGMLTLFNMENKLVVSPISHRVICSCVIGEEEVVKNIDKKTIALERKNAFVYTCET
ncbi:hypothetical protein HPG69_003299 [Diceros bicornis minor]|uniref:Uncharacterized protein n=1 Tax=Diceros bicornis minor TaxID=77932 RepID=A0A7J7E8A6_DICBM|nr:hypothetical protein HPG69_003299 [Diceros bicornis minor]